MTKWIAVTGSQMNGQQSAVTSSLTCSKLQLKSIWLQLTTLNFVMCHVMFHQFASCKKFCCIFGIQGWNQESQEEARVYRVESGVSRGNSGIQGGIRSLKRKLGYTGWNQESQEEARVYRVESGVSRGSSGIQGGIRSLKRKLGYTWWNQSPKGKHGYMGWNQESQEEALVYRVESGVSRGSSGIQGGIRSLKRKLRYTGWNQDTQEEARVYRVESGVSRRSIAEEIIHLYFSEIKLSLNISVNIIQVISGLSNCRLGI